MLRYVRLLRDGYAPRYSLAAMKRRVDAGDDGHGNRCVPPWGPALDRLRVTRVILAAAHLDHDPMNSAPSNLKSLCQRCHMLHDRPYHLAQRWLTYRMRWAIGDLFLGPYVRG